MSDGCPLKTFLFDLDDTLLGNKMAKFLPRYFALLGEYARPRFPDRERLLKELMHSTRAMASDVDSSRTNREIFWQVFSKRMGVAPTETEQFFNRFYEEWFPRLRSVTEERPAAVRLVNRLLEEGYKVGVATNPLFPRAAIEQRLLWAGLPVSEFDFALVTTYENMHASKPHGAYYEEILERIDARPQSTLMVGDDWGNDIVPTVSLGMRAFWIAAPDKSYPSPLPDDALLIGTGSLDGLYDWLRNKHIFSSQERT